MTKHSEPELEEQEEYHLSPQHNPPAPPDELFDVATTVDPGYVISLIRKILPPNVGRCYYSNDDKSYEDLVQPSKPCHIGCILPSPSRQDGLDKCERNEKVCRDPCQISELSRIEQAWEESGCILWDLAASETHAEFMVQHFILKVIFENLNCNHSVRIKEITLGIIGNLACHKGPMNHIVSSEGLMEIITDQLFFDDAPSLCEACSPDGCPGMDSKLGCSFFCFFPIPKTHCIRVLTLGVRGDRAAQWEDVLQHDNVLCRLLWVAENTLNPQLIEKSVDLLLALLESHLPSAASIRATMMEFGLPNLLINLLSFEMGKFMNERLSERYAAMESILCALEALSVSAHYSSKICSNKELFNLISDFIKLSDKAEVPSLLITAAVLLANMLVDEPGLASGLYHDVAFMNGLLDTLPFASDDTEARNAIWRTVGVLLKPREGDGESREWHESHDGEKLVMILASKAEVIEDDLFNQHHHSSSNTLPIINATLGRMLVILSKWSSSSSSTHAAQVSSLLHCCSRFHFQT